MKALKKLFAPPRYFSWKVCMYASILVLPLLMVGSFYGLYSNQFYLLKVDNYIFPLFSTVHFIYLYAVQFKVREQEFPDPQLRNVEYAMYAVLFIYIFKIVDTLYILQSYDDYDAHIIPSTFLPVGLTLLALHGALVYLTLAAFYYRRHLVGAYNFDQINENFDSWH